MDNSKLITEFNSDATEWEYDDFILEVQTYIDKSKIKNFFCYGLNLTWRKVAGYTLFETTDAKTLINRITPNTSDFTIRLEKTDERGVVQVTTYHHDAPTGEIMYLMSQQKCNRLGVMEEFFGQ